MTTQNWDRAGTLFAVGVSMPDFWRTHQSVGDIEGFNLRACNAMLGTFSAALQCLPCAVVEYVRDSDPCLLT